MKSFLSYCLIAFVLLGCASFSENFVKEGDLSLRGGRYEDQQWSERLKFERVSWFQELTLLFDFLYVSIDSQSPFYQWLDQREKDELANCAKSYIVMTYALDSRKVSKHDFFNKLASQGVRQLSVPHFRSFIRNHPDIERQSLHLYDISSICASSEDSIVMDIPGFRKVMIE